ncbi:Cytochrome c oxidase assembly protein cox15, partial [Elasticomyces elasticus]
FPFMGNGLAPPSSELFDAHYSRHEDRSDLWWRNMLENPSLVQLDHRVLATTTFCAVHALWAYARWNPTAKRLLGASARSGVALVLGLVWVQVTLGVSTLLYLVPTPLAAAHQAGALALLSGMLVLGSRVWVPKRAMRLLRLRMSTAGSKGMGVGGARGPGAVLNARNGGVERVVA